ncbi:MAG: AAA family ATPase [Clostridia bacterium]|nr:AAA family ATPase [Clostridia bacterium]
MKMFHQASNPLVGNYCKNSAKASRDIAKLKRYYASVTFPEQLLHGLDDLIGMEGEREIVRDALKFLNNIEEFQDDPLLSPHTRFLLGGAPGSGKSILVNALAKTAGVPLITMSLSAFGAFPKKIKNILDLIFGLAESMPGGCIILFNDYSAVESIGANQMMFFHNHLISKIVKNNNSIVFLSTTAESFKVPTFYFEANAFSQNKTITMQPPTLKTREELINSYFKKYQLALAEDVSAERLAKNTFGMYPKDIEYVVRETMLYAARKEHLLISSKDFNEVMLTMVAGQMHNKLTEKERISTAYHEAGHVIAAYYSNPEYILGRVEITPRARSLGLTQEEAGEEKYGLFKHEFEYNIIYSLGGFAAEMVIYGETTTGTSADLLSANACVALMYQQLGMSEELGPIVFDDENGFCSDKFFYDSEVIMQAELKRLQNETIDIVKNHRTQLEALTQELLKHEVLLGNEIKKVLDAADIAAGIEPKPDKTTSAT